jgi:hypothetical protein
MSLQMRVIAMTGAAALLTGGLAAEDTPPAPTRPGCTRLAAPGAERGPLQPDQQEAIAEALLDEYQGEAVYARVLEDLGEARPFSNVVHAERRHAALLEGLLEGRGLPVPENRWAAAEVPTYASRVEACAAAAGFEARNAALYDRLLASGSLPDDVRRVFEHNRWASLERHRPAFERCGGQVGTPAVAGRGNGWRCGRGRGRTGRGRQGGGGCARGCGYGGGAGPGAGRGRRGGGAGNPRAGAPAESGS